MTTRPTFFQVAGIAGIAVLLSALGLHEAHAESRSSAAQPAAYPLDDVPRTINARGRVKCPKVSMVRYRGDVIRYHKPVRVNSHFRPRLVAFEKIVAKVATEFYGRAPRRIRHMGTYNCRRIRRWPTFLSEHGLANAIDVEGFDFGPLRGPKAKGFPARLRRGFKVRLDKDWTGKRRHSGVHSNFLRKLAREVIARPDVFTVVLGPAEPGHHNHFHLDVSPFRLVNVFE